MLVFNLFNLFVDWANKIFPTEMWGLTSYLPISTVSAQHVQANDSFNGLQHWQLFFIILLCLYPRLPKENGGKDGVHIQYTHNQVSCSTVTTQESIISNFSAAACKSHPQSRLCIQICLLLLLFAFELTQKLQLKQYQLSGIKHYNVNVTV